MKKKKKINYPPFPFLFTLLQSQLHETPRGAFHSLFKIPPPLNAKQGGGCWNGAWNAAEKNHKSGPINAHVWPLDARNPRKTINPVVTRVFIKPFFFFFQNDPLFVSGIYFRLSFTFLDKINNYCPYIRMYALYSDIQRMQTILLTLGNKNKRDTPFAEGRHLCGEEQPGVFLLIHSPESNGNEYARRVGERERGRRRKDRPLLLFIT